MLKKLIKRLENDVVDIDKGKDKKVRQCSDVNEINQELDGKKHGLHIDWYENGQLLYEYNYKNGKFHGLLRVWHKNGQLSLECNYIDGQEHGLSREWHEDGQLWMKCNYVNGRYISNG